MTTHTTATKITLRIWNQRDHCRCSACGHDFTRKPRKAHRCPKCKQPARELIFTANYRQQ